MNLRAWFIGFVVWLGLLTFVTRWGWAAIDEGNAAVGWAVWIFGVYAFYLSLCCTFFPAPTAWIVLLAASDTVAAQIGLGDSALWRLVAVSTVGAAASGLASLNEYHVFTYLLRHRRVARVRETRLYDRASIWFRANPFGVVTLFGFLPIPVDVVRWLAIAVRYPRMRFFWAYFVGRWFRYALMALAAVGLHLTVLQIMVIQGALVAAALIRFVPRFLRRGEGRDARDGAASSTGDGAPVADESPVVAGDAGRA